MHFSLGVFVTALALLLTLPLAGGAATNTTRTSVMAQPYQFDPRDGWESVMVTNLRYKYRRSLAPTTTPDTNSSNALTRPSGTLVEHSSRKNALRFVAKSLAQFTKGIMGTGKPEPVIITWYTGHDLRNPSCWSNPKWTPTDESFVAALTLSGWSNKPQCFEFLELCSNSTHCTFARVVDTCAGCEKGSKHVDLTRAAFEQLASLEQGVLTVWMRRASEPAQWDVALWGPRNN